MDHHHRERRRASPRDGDVRESGARVGGLRHGVWRTWDAEGHLLAEAMYWRGERVWSIEYRPVPPATDAGSTRPNRPW